MHQLLPNQQKKVLYMWMWERSAPTSSSAGTTAQTLYVVKNKQVYPVYIPSSANKLLLLLMVDGF